MINVNGSGAWWGVIISSMLWIIMTVAAISNEIETTTPAIGSAFPCPYGWSLSAGFIAIVSPARTTNETKISNDQAQMSNQYHQIF